MSRYIKSSEAIAPFQVFEVAPTYHPVTDGITGCRSYPDIKGGCFETLSGAKARLRAGWTEDDLQDVQVEIRDSLGRIVFEPLPPMECSIELDEILF